MRNNELANLLKRTYSEAGSDKKTITSAGTPERITDQPFSVAQVLIEVLSTNTGLIYVGYDKGLSSEHGFELGEKLVSVTIPIDDLSKIWLDVAVDGEGVCYMWVR